MSDTMLAFRRQKKEYWAAATVRVPIPEPGDDDVLIEVDETAGCGSDLHALNNAPGSELFPAEVTFGHEMAGRVKRSGKNVRNLPVGTPVTMIAIQGCRSCEFCTSGYMQLCKARRVQELSFNGGMAEYVVVNQHFVKPVPEELPTTARSLIEPTTIATHCVDLLGDIRGQRIVLPGAGIIAVLTALVAREAGADVTLTGLERDQHTRLKKAADLGFKTIVTGSSLPSLAAQYRELHGRPFADILLDASGAPEAVMDGFAAGYDAVVKPGGEIMLVAIYERGIPDFRLTSLVRWQRRLTTSYGSDPKDYDRAIKLLLSGSIPVEQLVVRYKLEDAFQAYKDAAESRVLKPVIVCNRAA